MSDTPETVEAVERWQQGKINIFDEMARLETERNQSRSYFESGKIERRQLRCQLADSQNEAKNWKKAYEGLQSLTLRHFEVIAEDCEGWLNNQCDETACEFIKAVRDYAKTAANDSKPYA